MALAGMAATLSGCGKSADDGGTVFSNPSLGFSITVPRGWTARDSSGQVTLVVTGPAAEDGSRPNVNVVVEPRSTSLDYFVKETLESLQQTYKDKGFRIISQERRIKDGQESATCVTFEESATGQTVRQRQLYAVGLDRVFTVTATATPDTFAKYETEFDSMFAHFLRRSDILVGGHQIQKPRATQGF